MTNPTFWNQFLVWPIVNLLLVFYKAFEALHVPGPLGFAVIALTISIRLLLSPLMRAQLRSAKKMQNLKPHLDALSVKHKNDKTTLQKAQLELYKQHGVNPAAGCLPLLVQFPFLIALYNVFYQVLQNGDLQKLLADINTIVYHPVLKLQTLDLTFFGINLGIRPSQWTTHGWWLLSIPLLTGLLQWYQTKLMMPTSPTHNKQPASPAGRLTTNNKEEKKTDTAAEMQKQMAIMTPIMFGFFAYQFPLGLALYWNIFGIMGMLQQLSINREK
ncbi:hypothetical protein A3A79_02610 [Candidatus Gottesmanbacteria bacterium RIFCSPLOWO2_01_FULL_43_11b]|uniref:Membrane insertase YidC/Oxa/ALB C-terminal domain-containing protein n=1 Tax=Candidatus Gottesmanbacteria bacterium RIFCSPLOWO2_01_FULL_43_11b TaxID=1798392 RepID=A0A1F6AH62_9BACT|nr:MAG: hypothetical protein A3A79_02610 [Candidatus Gottesmanbacteria bacterium RIFCSPLOWO2_01_FULL_43_11b]